MFDTMVEKQYNKLYYLRTYENFTIAETYLSKLLGWRRSQDPTKLYYFIHKSNLLSLS